MMNPRFASGGVPYATTTTRTFLPFLAFALLIVLICSSTPTNADVVTSPVSIQDISYRANVKVVPQKDFATLGIDTNRDKNLVILELNVQLDKKSKHGIQSINPHSLLAADDNKVILEVTNQNKLYSSNYEEIEHDITPQRIGTGASYDLNHNVLPIIRRREGVSTESFENCLYTGKVRGMQDSTVSISTCSGSLTGWINTPQGSFSIENTAEQHKLRQDAKSSTTGAYHGVQAFNTLSQQRVLAKNGDLHALSELVNNVQLVDVNEEQRRLKAHEDKVSGKADTKTCAADHTHHQVPADTLLKIGYDHASLKRRQELLDQQVSSTQDKISTLADDDGQVKKDRFLEVVLYHDYKRLQFFNTSAGMTMEDLMDEAREHSLEIFNNMVGFYKNSDFPQHNVHLILSGHVFFLNGDPYTKYLHRGGGLLVISGSGLLENFNKYRNYYGHKGDVGVLLSNYNFQSNIKGVANVGSLCSGPRYNGNINSVTYRNVALSSVLVAHEIGHVLSCNHDDNDSRWIMYPYVVSATKFSPRSKHAADYHFSRTRCANNDPRQQLALGDGSSSSTSNIGTLSLNNQHDHGETDNQQQEHHEISYIYSDYAKRQDYHDKVDLDFLRDHAQEYSVLLDDDLGSTTTTADYDEVIAEVIDDERYVNHNYQPQQSAAIFSQLKNNNVTTLTTPSLLAAIILAAIGGSVLSVFTLAGLFVCAKKSAILSNLFTPMKKDEQLSPSPASTLQPRSSNNTGNLPNASPNRFAFTPKHTSIMNAGGDIPALNTRTTNNNIATIDPPTPRGEYNNYPASPAASYSSTTRHRAVDSDGDEDGNNHSDRNPLKTHRVIFEDLTAD